MAKSDFLSWDDDFNDLELDFILGEYTEDESVADNVSAVVSPAKTSKTKDCIESGYLCPICKKSLKSISGFRGHTSKQHGRSDLKGSIFFLIWYSIFIILKGGVFCLV